MTVGEGIVEKGALQGGQIEAPGRGARLVRRQLDEVRSQNWSSFSANTVRPAAFSGPSWASAGGRMTSA